MKVLAIVGGRYLLPFIVFITFFHSTPWASAQDVTVAGTPQQTNQRIRSMSEQATKSSPHEYTIGNGDLVDISVFDVQELSREVRVSQNGTISLPLVPTRIRIAGLTEIQAEQKVADILEANGLVTHAEVGVVVKEHRSRPITIVGAVVKPMVYEADRPVTLLEVLAEAGGVANDAGDTIIVTRPRAAVFIPVANPEPIADSAPGSAASSGTEPAPVPGSAEEKPKEPNTDAVFPAPSEPPTAPATVASAAKPDAPAVPPNIITINLNELLERGDMQNNIPLQAGDVVTVPHAGIVYILGAINRPGGFVLSNDRTQLTTLKILSLGGGLTRTAQLDRAVIIRKDSQGKETQQEVDLKKIINRQSEDVQMRASDILYIPDSKTKQVLYQTLAIATAVGTAVAIYRVAYQ